MPYVHETSGASIILNELLHCLPGADSGRTVGHLPVKSCLTSLHGCTVYKFMSAVQVTPCQMSNYIRITNDDFKKHTG
jgi:hypothetical protein